MTTDRPTGTLTIGEVAARTGFTASALRYYERVGLVVPAGRTDAGYRIYDDSSLQRLGFVSRAKELGCTLDEIIDLVALWDSDDYEPVQRRMHALLTAKIADAQRRISELVEFTAQLQAAAARLDSKPSDGVCGPDCACMTYIDTERPIRAQVTN